MASSLPRVGEFPVGHLSPSPAPGGWSCQGHKPWNAPMVEPMITPLPDVSSKVGFGLKFGLFILFCNRLACHDHQNSCSWLQNHSSLGWSLFALLHAVSCLGVGRGMWKKSFQEFENIKTGGSKIHTCLDFLFSDTNQGAAKKSSNKTGSGYSTWPRLDGCKTKFRVSMACKTYMGERTLEVSWRGPRSQKAVGQKLKRTLNL